MRGDGFHSLVHGELDLVRMASSQSKILENSSQEESIQFDGEPLVVTFDILLAGAL